MSLCELQLNDFRNLAHTVLRPGTGPNLLVGRNGAGKTAVLEAVYFLARGRSFRGSDVRTLVRYGAKEMSVFARTLVEGGAEHRIGAGWDGKERRLRVDGKDHGKISEVSRIMPVSVLMPQSHEILDRGPEYRRKLLDWGMFHVEPSYGEEARRYFRALHQRNSALKARSRAAAAWEDVLGEQGERIDARRKEYVGRLNAELQEISERLCNGAVTIHLRRGWPQERGSLAQLLRRSREADQERGHTTLGPHRADLDIVLEGRRGDRFASRGQQKLLVAAIILAQSRLVQHKGRSRVLMLVDDFGSELDQKARRLLWDALANSGSQVLVTATEGLGIPQPSDLPLFHVEHGSILPV